MRRASCLLALIGLVAALPLQSASAGSLKPAPGLRVGVGKADITPPLFDPVADAQAFPLCPPAVFTGARAFALQ